LDEAARGFAAAGLSAYLALVTLQRAALSLDNDDWPAASAYAEQAGRLFTERGLVIRQAQADLIHARASFAQGDADTAARLARSVLVTSQERDVRWLAHEAHHILGNVADAGGNDEAALRAYDEAVKSIERLQSSLAIDLRTNFLEDKVQIYEDAIAASLRLSRPETAFAYLERAKSRALVDYLANHLEVQIKAREGADQELLDTLARLRQEHNWFYNRLYGYGIAEGGNAGPTLSPDALRAAILEREKQIARLLERLALDRTEGLAVGAEVSPHSALPTLDADTVLLEYYLPQKGGAVFVVSAKGLTVVPLAVRPAEIHRLLHQWHLNLTTTAAAIASNAPLDGLGRNARGVLGMLYRALIAPVAVQIAGYERLIVVPYGPTHTVPFHALFDGERFLLEQVDVSVSPSSGVLQLCASRPRPAGRSALVVAHSDGGRLPAVLDEARAVAALLPGECYVEDAATRDALIAAAPHHRVLHLAAHGEARLDNPAFAHVKLADGQLSTMDIFNLELSGALITLSACETGRSVVTGGDELIGLSRGFLYAGAATLVQSLWRVEDDATALLMRHFYTEIRAGKTKSAALREAQRASLATNGVHPYFWAPFQLIGDRGPL
jgi:CHAT domain-containing protein